MVGATGFEPATSCSRSRRATKLRYAPPTVSILEPGCAVPPHRSQAYFPTSLTNTHAECSLVRISPVDLLDELEHLAGGVPHRHHHPPALGELLEERRRHARPSRRHQDALERRLVRPAQRAVRRPHPHVAIPQCLQASGARARRAAESARSCTRAPPAPRARPPGTRCPCRSRAPSPGPSSRRSSVIRPTMKGCEIVCPSPIGSG